MSDERILFIGLQLQDIARSLQLPTPLQLQMDLASFVHVGMAEGSALLLRESVTIATTGVIGPMPPSAPPRMPRATTVAGQDTDKCCQTRMKDIAWGGYSSNCRLVGLVSSSDNKTPKPICMLPDTGVGNNFTQFPETDFGGEAYQYVFSIAPLLQRPLQLQKSTFQELKDVLVSKHVPTETNSRPTIEKQPKG
ncbi:hypothetical protein SK128_014290 [Halocaridina rubra]|uniref:Uncharacterized protein n=1 Tax=Halocaridina rubra TaxID=373956 RepID=A0AAN8XW88_HALRR